MSVATAGDVVQVRPGVYDVSNLEVFPIVVGVGVTLLGDEANKGRGPTPTIIAGNGAVPSDLSGQIRAAVYPLEGAVVAGLHITNPSPASGGFPNGVVLQYPGFVLRNNTISDSTENGVYANQWVGVIGQGLIVGNVVQGNYWGLSFVGANDGVRIERNVISWNEAGVYVSSDAPGVDLGGGATGSVGQNTFSCNLNSDLYVELANLFAENCLWDHTPPSSTDVTTASGASVQTAGAALAPGGCP